MRMAADTESVVWARISGARFGRTWRRMTCQSPAPRAFARSTYGRASRVSVWARTSRAVGGQAVSPMATTTVRTPRCITLASAAASTRVGSTRNQSVTRISSVGTQPRKWPATMPVTEPMPTDIVVASRPTSREIRAPQMVTATIERP